ncbi:hypothetical protein [Gloeothece citriformis]|uniref:hypothetical protein n=1 Tax=Gloeothece citriformis TaxID=2546356 RepID=UPI0002F93ADA|nr:hypothetical protein [Gloeothece citriformis]
MNINSLYRRNCQYFCGIAFHLTFLPSSSLNLGLIIHYPLSIDKYLSFRFL